MANARQAAFEAVLTLLRQCQRELSAPTETANRIELAYRLRLALGEAIIAYGAACSAETRDALLSSLRPTERTPF